MRLRRQHLTLDSSVAVITGASSGIGEATAEALYKKGCRLVLVGRNAVALAAVAKRTEAVRCIADLAEPTGPSLVVQEAEVSGGPDILVCNAGVGWAGPLVTMPPEEIDRLVQVNLLSCMRLVRAALPGMLARGRGHIVLVSSIAGNMGVAEEAVYSATKAGLRVFGDAVRMECVGRGVDVTVVSPGAVRTPFFSNRGAPYRRRLPRQVPPECVAAAIVAAIERHQAEVFIPHWLHWPARLQGATPGLVRPLQRRFG